MEFQNYRDCNPHKFEIPAFQFPCRVPVIPCKHLQCMSANHHLENELNNYNTKKHVLIKIMNMITHCSALKFIAPIQFVHFCPLFKTFFGTVLSRCTNVMNSLVQVWNHIKKLFETFDQLIFFWLLRTTLTWNISHNHMSS